MDYQFGSPEHLQSMIEKSQQQFDRQTELQYLERQAIAAEEANKKAEKAIQEARKSRNVSILSALISLGSLLVAIAAIVIS